MILRSLLGLVLGAVLLLLGIPLLQSVLVQSGYFTSFSFEQAALTFILILLCVIAAQIGGLRPPPE